MVFLEGTDLTTGIGALRSAERSYLESGDDRCLTEAVRVGRLARQSDYRTSEPMLESNLATVLHGRFRLEGWSGELDEAIDRNRRAVAGQNDGAPAHRVLLSNLAGTLEDRDNFVGDEAALEEAIELRERALALSTAGSPGHSGYLSSLASALRAQMLLGYARMLAGQHDLLREQGLPAQSQANVTQVFQRAIAGSAQSPVTRFDAADALGACARSARANWPTATKPPRPACGPPVG